MCALSWTRQRKTRRRRPKYYESNFYLVGFLFGSPKYISLSVYKPVRLARLQSPMVASYPLPNCELRRTSKFAGDCGALDKLSIVYVYFSPLFQMRYCIFMYLPSTLPTTTPAGRLQPTDNGGGKDLIPIRPVALLGSNFEGKTSEMYQLV